MEGVGTVIGCTTKVVTKSAKMVQTTVVTKYSRSVLSCLAVVS